MTGSKNKLSPKDRIALYEMLKPMLKEVEGGWEYTNGYDDGKVSKLSGCTRMQVTGIRVALFGNLAQPKKSSYVSIPEIVARLAAMEQAVAALEARIGTPAAA